MPPTGWLRYPDLTRPGRATPNPGAGAGLACPSAATDAVHEQHLTWADGHQRRRQAGPRLTLTRKAAFSARHGAEHVVMEIRHAIQLAWMEARHAGERLRMDQRHAVELLAQERRHAREDRQP